MPVPRHAASHPTTLYNKNLLEPARGVGIESHRIPWNLMESPRNIRLFQQNAGLKM